MKGNIKLPFDFQIFVVKNNDAVYIVVHSFPEFIVRLICCSGDIFDRIHCSFAFFLLGFGFSAMGSFFKSNQLLFARVGGILVVLFGFYQLGFFGKSGAMGKEHRLPFKLDMLAMSPITALVMGFTFSFAWTPCVGPTLSSVLLMASSAESSAAGFLLIGVYTLGFVLPFLAVGLFTGTVLDFFKSHQNVVRYTVKIGAVLLIVMGILTLTGATGGISADLAAGSGTVQEEPAGNSGEEAAPSGDSQEEHSGADSQEIPVVPAPDFTLTDQYGQSHTLSDYQGKTVFLNFWATWCGPCKMEMPDIQALYEDWDENAGELVVLGVAGPNIGQEGSAEDITAFLEENGYTYPVVMDETGTLFYQYGISAYPTTFMIDTEGNVFGYVQGAVSREVMDDIVEQTRTGQRR